MRASRIMRWAAGAAVVTAPALRAQGAPPAQQAAAPAAAPAAPAAPPSICGNTPYCAETNDFAAVITNFRTSDLRGYKIIDVVMHFQNKTANSLVLAYAQNSGTIIDDKGNRYIVWGANGVRGIGQVYGGAFDPKFTLPAGGNGDAQFELAWYPGQQIYGFNFAFDLTIDEINSYEGNQHSLGGEFPLHYQGLANGISSGGQLAAVAGAVGAAAGGGGRGAAGGGGAGGGGAAGGDAQPCNNGGVAGTATAVANATGSQAVQGAAAQGASTVATAASAVQSIASIFGKKKPQPDKPASANPCGAAGGTGAQAASTGAAAASTRQAPGGAVATSAPPKTTAAPTATVAKNPTVPAGKATPTVTTSAGQLATRKPAATTAAPAASAAAHRTGGKKTVTPDTSKSHP